MTSDREYARYLSDQRLRAWEKVITAWVDDLLARRLQSIRQRLAQVWTEAERAKLRAENAEVGRRARLDTHVWPEYLTATTTSYSLEGKSPERDYLKDTARWAEQVREEGTELFGRLLTRTSESMTTGTISGRDLVNSPGVRDILNERLQWVLSSTENRVDQILDAVLAPEHEGEPLEEVWNRVKGTLNQRRLWARVAGNALAASTLNAAVLEAAILNGANYKQWLSSRDDRVRFTHAFPLGDGQTVGVRESFIIGGIPLQYPGDKAAFAYGRRGMAQIYGCRCTLLVDAEIPGFGDGPSPQWASPRSILEGMLTPPASAADVLGQMVTTANTAPLRFAPQVLMFALLGMFSEASGADQVTPADLARVLGVPLEATQRLLSLVESWATALALVDVVAIAYFAHEIIQTVRDMGVSQEQVDSIQATLDQRRTDVLTQ